LSDVKEYIKEGKLNYAEGGVVYLYYGGEEDYKTIKVSSQAEAERIAMWNGAEHWDYVKD